MFTFRYKLTQDGFDMQVSVHADNHAEAYKRFDEKVDEENIYEYELLDSVFEQMTAA